MGSKQSTKQNSTSTSQLAMDPAIQAQINQGYGNLNNQFANLQSKPLGLEYFTGFSSSPDAIVNNMVSQGISNIKGQQSAADQALANQLSVQGTGNNSALLAALQNRGKFATAGAMNALVPQALEQQRAFDIAKAGLVNQNNQTRFGARSSDLATLGQQANLLQMLQQYGAATGKQTNTESTNSVTKKKGGVLGLF